MLGIFLREDKDLIAAPSDALKIDHVTMQLFPGVSDQGVLEPPGFLNRMVARLRRAPRWQCILPAISGKTGETGPDLRGLQRLTSFQPPSFRDPSSCIVVT